jgi:hypothetical protein
MFVLPVEPLAVTPTRVVVLVVGFLVLVLPVVLPLVGLLLLDLPAAWLALAAIVALAELPVPVEAVTRVVRKEPRTASSSSCARALTETPTNSARPKIEIRILCCIDYSWIALYRLAQIIAGEKSQFFGLSNTNAEAGAI